jgi:hypothetical protein
MALAPVPARRDIRGVKSMALVMLALALALGCARGNAGGNSTVDSSNKGSDASTPIDAGIDGNGCATQPCDIPTQCGCAAGMACDIDSMTSTATACRAVTMQGMETSTCPADTDCARGYVCVGDGTNDACEKYCQSNMDCTGPRGQCVDQLVDASNNPIPGAVVCSSDCDPSLVNNSMTCPAGWTCDLYTATYMTMMYDIVDCRKAGTKTENQACSATALCAAGYSCVNDGISDVCARICKYPTGTNCPTGTTCGEFQTPFTVGGTEYGVCL